MRIAIVGSGIAGLGSAWILNRRNHAVTLFEAESALGGHTRTVDVTLDGVTAPVDTGFLVYNDRTYPRLVALFRELGVESIESDMSFSVRNDAIGIEWAGTDFASLFAQPANALRPDFWRMLADIVRFNRDTRALVECDAIWSITLAEYLDAGRYSRGFRDGYLLPMCAAIWSAPKSTVLDFPLPTFARFCHNHGLLQIADRPRWRTVRGGARDYVARIARALDDVRLATPVDAIRRDDAGVQIIAGGAIERFDQVVLACHADQSLSLLADASPEERRLLSAIRFQRNRTVLHTDVALMPRHRRAWSAWNHLATRDEAAPVAVSYWLNRLQRLPFPTPVMVTLNPPFEPARERVIDDFEFDHPLLDAAAVVAQDAVARLSGRRHTWYAGAWLGNGFHEDGIRSAHAVADGIARIAARREQRDAWTRAAA